MIESAIALEGTKKKQSLLIVDDELDITFVLQMMLADYYDSVDAHTNPVEELGSVRSGRYDLILFDYLMPEMNGYEFYCNVKRIDPAVHICMMTAYEAILTDHKGDQPVQPFDSKFVLKKPFDLEKILSTLEVILKGG